MEDDLDFSLPIRIALAVLVILIWVSVLVQTIKISVVLEDELRTEFDWYYGRPPWTFVAPVALVVFGEAAAAALLLVVLHLPI